MKKLKILAILFVIACSTSCSFSTAFVIVNESTEPLEVQYRLKGNSVDFAPSPSVAPANSIDKSGSSQWTKLGPDRIKVFYEQRRVALQLQPGEALRVCSMHNYFEDEGDKREFPINEVKLAGKNGELFFTNDQARKAFTKVSGNLYKLPYK